MGDFERVLRTVACVFKIYSTVAGLNPIGSGKDCICIFISSSTVVSLSFVKTATRKYNIRRGRRTGTGISELLRVQEQRKSQMFACLFFSFCCWTRIVVSMIWTELTGEKGSVNSVYMTRQLRLLNRLLQARRLPDPT